MRRGSKEKWLLLGGVIILIASAATLSYMVASYQNTLQMKKVQIIYEYKIENISIRTEKFEDNLSRALTYIDIARSDLEMAKLNLDKSLFWVSEKVYRELSNSSSNAMYYFNRSNAIFKKALYYLFISLNFSIESYEEVLMYYINYTKAAINLTEIGSVMSQYLNNASSYFLQGDEDKGNTELQKFDILRESYNEWNQIMVENLIKIKTFYGIRD